jgi:hypothetical protein
MFVILSMFVFWFYFAFFLFHICFVVVLFYTIQIIGSVPLFKYRLTLFTCPLQVSSVQIERTRRDRGTATARKLELIERIDLVMILFLRCYCRPSLPPSPPPEVGTVTDTSPTSNRHMRHPLATLSPGDEVTVGHTHWAPA